LKTKFETKIRKRKSNSRKTKECNRQVFQALGQGLQWGTKGTLLMIQSMQDCLDVHVAE
jgi:hypothetical protein